MLSFLRIVSRCACVAVVCGSFCCAKSRIDPPRPALQVLDLDGKPVNVWANSGTIQVVVFTRTDCPISNRFAPEIRSLHEMYHPRGVDIILIYVDPRQTPDEIRKHVREYDYPCRAARDPSHALVAFCHATTTPEAVVFARDRSIAYQGRISDQYLDLGKSRSTPTRHDLADAIESTLRGEPVVNPRTQAVGCLIEDVKE